MKNLIVLFSFCLILISCSKKELTKEIATPIISGYYDFKSQTVFNNGGISDREHKTCFQTEIAIDQIYDDYGWPSKKYKELEQSGLISLKPLPAKGLGADRFEMVLSKDGENYLKGKRIWHTQTNGDIDQFLFYGYTIVISNISISSNAKDKTAKAEVLFLISDQSKIQQIFDPVKDTQFKRNLYFKLFDDGWKIVDDEKSHLKTHIIDNPLHWADN